MSEASWRDMIVGDRMRVDQEFADQVRQSGLSNQEWSLVMTAVRLEVQGTGDDATLVADTSRVPDIVPEMERVNRQLGAYGRGEGDGGGGSGLLDGLKRSLGLGGETVDEDKLRRAEQLASDYARALERHLRQHGKWSMVTDQA